MSLIDLQIAEIPYETGEVQFRYSRYLAADGTLWIRHGSFRAYYKNGRVASEGEYDHGLESGVWRDYHENGRIAAEGEYRGGVESGLWRYWSSDGALEKEVLVVGGVETN